MSAKACLIQELIVWLLWAGVVQGLSQPACMVKTNTSELSDTQNEILQMCTVGIVIGIPNGGHSQAW